MLYLEHALLTATGDPALLSVPRDAFQLCVVWYGNLFAAKNMRTYSYRSSQVSVTSSQSLFVLTSDTRT